MKTADALAIGYARRVMFLSGVLVAKVSYHSTNPGREAEMAAEDCKHALSLIIRKER